MKRKMKWGLIGIVIIISIITGVYYILKPLEVETLTLQRQDVYQYVEETGQVVSRNTVDITSLMTQKIETIYKENGDFVKVGDTICRLNTDDLKWQRQQTMRLFEKAQESNGLNLSDLKSQIGDQGKLVNQAEAIYNQVLESQAKAQVLYDSGALSKDDLDQASLALKSAQTDLSRAKGALNALQNKYQTLIDSDGYLVDLKQTLDRIDYQISQSDIKAPVQGMIINQDLHVGQIVSPQMPLGQIIDPSKMEIVSRVLAEDSYLIQRDTPVRIELKVSGQNQTFEGQVVDISPSAETEISSLGISEQRMAVTIKSQEMDSLLKPGFKVNVKFISGYVGDALQVPKTAVFYDGDDAFVYVNESGKAVQTKVTLGMETDDQIVITEGLTQGQRVLVNENLEGLADGARIHD